MKKKKNFGKILINITNSKKLFKDNNINKQFILNQLYKKYFQFSFKSFLNFIFLNFIFNIFNLIYIFKYNYCADNKYCKKNFFIFKKHIKLTKKNKIYLNNKFCDCFNLKFIILNSENVNQEMFFNCIKLKYIYLYNTKYIMEDAFKNCISLKIIYIPKTIKKININAFSNCINLQKVVFY